MMGLNDLKVDYREDAVNEVVKMMFAQEVRRIIGDSDKFPELEEVLKNLNSQDVDLEQLVMAISNTIEDNADKYDNYSVGDSRILKSLREFVQQADNHVEDLAAAQTSIREIEKQIAKLRDTEEGYSENKRDLELSVAEQVRKISTITKQLGSNDAIAVVPPIVIERMLDSEPADEVIKENVLVSNLIPDTPQPYQTYGNKVREEEEENLKRQQELERSKKADEELTVEQEKTKTASFSL